MRIGIFAAEKQEVECIQSTLCGTKTEKAGLVFYEAPYGQHTVISVCGGIGKVHAALCTQLLICSFHVDMIINTGTAGALNDSLHVFDLVVSTDAVQHDVDASVFGYARGQVPGTCSPFWKADEALRSAMMEAFIDLKAGGTADIAKTTQICAGRIASGDRFIVDDKAKRDIAVSFGADCVEMEGAAVAQTCCIHAVPFVIVRCISDDAGKPAAISYEQFSKKASHLSALLVLRTIKRL